MRHRKMAGIMALTVFLTCGLPKFAAAHGSDEITDISGHWAQEAMLQWQEAELLFKDSNGKFNPDKEITRAEYITFINRMLNLKDTSKAVDGFKDIEQNSWYYKEFAKALAAGYISGTSSSNMSPKSLVTRQEAIVIFSRAAGFYSERTDETVLEGVKDAKEIAGWAKNAAAAAVSRGYVTGSEGKLKPLEKLTRADAIVMLNRYHSDERALYFPGNYSLGNIAALEITGPEVALSKTEVKGNLIIESSVGNGKVTLDGVKVNKLLKQKNSETELTLINGSAAQEVIKPDTWADGSYSGEAYGYKSDIQVNVQVKGGKLTGINIDKNDEDKLYFKVADGVVDKMLSENSTEVDTVSGATFSSRGIINAVKHALEPAITKKGYIMADSLTGKFKDGTYEGVARGLYAGLHVTAVIKDNRLAGLTLGANQEDRPYVDHAAEGVINSILKKQSADVDTVSSATYSSKGIINAAKYALNLASEKPAPEPEEKREGYSLVARYGGAEIASGDSWFYDVEEVKDGYVAAGLTSAGGVSNALIVKYDISGSLVWKKLIPDYRFGNIITTSKGLFLTGYHATDPDRTAEGEKGEDTNAAAIMISQDGTVLWEKSYGDGSVTAEGKISNDAFNQYWMWTNNAVELDNGMILTGGMSNASNGVFGSKLESHNGVLALIDSETGDIKKVNVFGSKEHDMAISLAKLSDGDIIVTGTSAGKDFSLLNGGWNNNDWAAKVFVMRVSKDLQTVKWTKLYQTEWESYQLSTVVDKSDNIYTAYSYKEKTKGVSMAKLDSSGKELWQKDYNYEGDSYVSALAMGTEGQPLLTVERYIGEHEDQQKFGLLNSINVKDGSVDWNFKFTSNNGALLFNIQPSSDGNIIAAGIEQDGMGYYIADLIKYKHEK